MKKKSQSGFVSIIIIFVILALGVIAGVAYYAGQNSVKEKMQPQPQREELNQENKTIEQNPLSSLGNSIMNTNFISPTAGSVWGLGSSMNIQLSVSPQWSHCSNGFYLYSSDNEEIGTIGIMTQSGNMNYAWVDISKRYATCGSGVGEYSIPVTPGFYKLCLKEINTETGIGENFYCSDNFQIQ